MTFIEAKECVDALVVGAFWGYVGFTYTWKALFVCLIVYGGLFVLFPR